MNLEEPTEITDEMSVDEIMAAGDDLRKQWREELPPPPPENNLFY